MDAWTRRLKERLREVAASPEGGGSQRQLAKRWLGDARKASEVSNWCSFKRDDVPEGAHKLHLLRTRCGTDLNWLLSEPEKPGEENGEWPTERRAKLAYELGDYAVHVVSERTYSRRLRVKVTEKARRLYGAGAFGSLSDPFYLVLSAVRGDFLKYFTAELEKLTDQAAKDAQRKADAIDAHAVRHEEDMEFWTQQARARTAEERRKGTYKPHSGISLELLQREARKRDSEARERETEALQKQAAAMRRRWKRRSRG